jgi:hypothetical protein
MRREKIGPREHIDTGIFTLTHPLLPLGISH